MSTPTALPKPLTRTISSSVEALNAIPKGASQKELLAGVRAAVDAFVKEAPQFDDLTMLGLKYNGSQDDATAEEDS